MDPCGHALCALIGGACSLPLAVSRGCRTGVAPPRAIADDVFDEIGALVATIEAGGDDRAPAARRLAEIVRREARDDRHAVAQARAEDLPFAPALARLCQRRA